MRKIEKKFQFWSLTTTVQIEKIVIKRIFVLLVASDSNLSPAVPFDYLQSGYVYSLNNEVKTTLTYYLSYTFY